MRISSRRSHTGIKLGVGNEADRSYLELVAITVISLAFPVISISIHFIDKVHDFFRNNQILLLGEYITNFIFLYIAGLLWFTHRRWTAAEKERKELEDIVSSISPDALVVVDSEGRILTCNDSVERMFGYEPDELLNRKVSVLYSESQTHPKHWHQVYEALEKEGFHLGTATGKRKDGSTLPVEVITGNVSSRKRAVLLIRDISERRAMEERLHSLSIMDELTGLYNRRGFFAFAQRQVLASERSGKGFLVIYTDLDHMKWINDTFGHNEGDRAIERAAEALKQTFRKPDIMSRIGGDEFAIIAVEADQESAALIVSRLHEQMEQINSWNDGRYTLSMSVGSAFYTPGHPCSIEELLKRADASMYEEKRSRNQASIAAP